jgi:methionyl-tRNA formyltransferase
MPLSIVFMGTPTFALTALEALAASHHRVVGVISQPDRPSGRGQTLQPPPVAAWATARGLPLYQPDHCRDDAFRERFAAFGADIAVVAAFGHILGPKALAIPRLGCVNIHASLLPRHRGASPITAAIDAGDAETGVCIMQMDRGLDTGPVLSRAALPIGPDDTTPTLHDRLAALGASLIVSTLDALEAGEITAEPQPDTGATYAKKLDKGLANLDFSEPAAAIARHVRAFDPWPGTRARVDGRLVRLLPPAREAEGWRHDKAPGTVLSAGPDGVRVACGGGTVVTFLTLQAEGRKALDAGTFSRGFPLAEGMVFTRAVA